jgi:hypothetical protein
MFRRRQGLQVVRRRVVGMREVSVCDWTVLSCSGHLELRAVLIRPLLLYWIRTEADDVHSHSRVLEQGFACILRARTLHGLNPMAQADQELSSGI